jgi:hypothetical protein
LRIGSGGKRMLRACDTAQTVPQRVTVRRLLPFAQPFDDLKAQRTHEAAIRSAKLLVSHPLTARHPQSLAERLDGNAAGRTLAGLLCGGGRCKPASCRTTSVAALADRTQKSHLGLIVPCSSTSPCGVNDQSQVALVFFPALLRWCSDGNGIGDTCLGLDIFVQKIAQPAEQIAICLANRRIGRRFVVKVF